MGTGGKGQTTRQLIIDLLLKEQLTIREISQAVSIPEKEVIDHMEHIERSITNQGKKVETLPYKCIKCGFTFDSRRRFSRPGRCPSCKNSHLQPAMYTIR